MKIILWIITLIWWLFIAWQIFITNENLAIVLQNIFWLIFIIIIFFLSYILIHLFGKFWIFITCIIILYIAYSNLTITNYFKEYSIFLSNHVEIKKWEMPIFYIWNTINTSTWNITQTWTTK